MVFLILYVDDILLIGNDKESMDEKKDWLSRKFQIKYLGDASYVLGFKSFGIARKSFWFCHRLHILKKYL